MKFLMIAADFFEDVEAMGTVDTLLRGGDEVTIASLMGRKEITTKCGYKMVLDCLVEDVDTSLYDALIIPGGPGSFKIMPSIPEVSKLINEFVADNKLVAAICAAPHLVGKLGYYKDRNYTVHPGFETPITGGHYLRDCGVVRDGNFITGKSMFYSLEFGLEIYKFFHGEAKAEALRKSMQGEK